MAKTVLLADDSNTIQRVVELAFAREDVTIVSVGDGERAVDTIRRSPPDLVVADIGMPHRTGYEVAEWVRSQPHLAGIPVILLAGAFEPADPDRARAVGADGVLTKPLDPTVLVRRVNDLLASGRGTAAAPGSTPALHTDAEAPVGFQTGSADQAASGPRHDAEPRSAGTVDADLYFDEVDRAFAQLTSAPRSRRPVVEPDDEDEATLTTFMAPPPMAAPSSAPIGDAFATLLDAERTGAVVLPLGRISLAPPAAQAPPPIDVDALADQIARRVLAQLSDRVVRETVSDLVSTTTERLVREEIERIKRNIT